MSKKTVAVSKVLNVFLEGVESTKKGVMLPTTLSPELKKEALMVAKGQVDDISDELYDALFDSEFSADMPYGTQKARTGDPFEWIIEKLQRIGPNLKEEEGESSDLAEEEFEAKKRFLAFGGDTYYPGGGLNDFMGSFDTLEEAESAVRQEDWYQILDVDQMKIVKQVR